VWSRTAVYQLLHADAAADDAATPANQRYFSSQINFGLYILRNEIFFFIFMWF